jgi:LacI family purine nucleotide synthesis repressor
MYSKSPPAEIDLASTEPVYLQLARVLAHQIVSKTLAPGSRLLQERDLASQYRLNRYTIRHALDVLEAQGLIQRVRGKGTFVTSGPSDKRWFSTAATILFVYVGATSAQAHPVNPYYAGIFAGVRRMARTLGLHLRTEGLRSYVRVTLDEYRPPQPHEVGGVIVCGTFDEQYIRMFGSEGVPVVVADFYTHHPQADSVVVDVESDAYTVAAHLAEKGHTRIGFIAVGRQESRTGLTEFDPDIGRMLDNLRRAAQERAIEMREDWILLALNAGAKLDESIGRLLALAERPTALVCFNPDAAVPALHGMERIGLRCPQDISILSRGSQALNGRNATALLGDPEMMGELAVKLLVERMHGHRQKAVRVGVVTQLVQGDTTGPAPVDRL